MAGKAKDITGYTTESGITVIKRVENKGTKPQWLCKCFCGNEFITRADALKSGHTKSCGCLQKKKAKEIITAWNKSIALDLTNKKFGKLTALEPTDKRSGTSIIWTCKCECGNYCEVSAAHLTEYHGTQSCGCVQSKGEAKIKQILEKNNIPYTSQFSISSCIFPDTNYPARFDFYVNNQYMIEYDGNVHYYSNGYGWNNEDNLTKVKNHDIIKNEWCKNNNIPLIRIPYTIYDNLSLDDLLLETSKYIVKGDNNE